MESRKARVERLRDAVPIMRQIRFLRACPEFQGFREAINAYVLHGVPASGKVRFRGERRVLEYALVVRCGVPCSAYLRYEEEP